MSEAAAASKTHEVSKRFLKEEQKKYFTFMNLAFLMTALTGIELVLIYLPFPGSVVLVGSLIGLSLIKFFGVILWFMHLIYDHRLLLVIFAVGMIFASATATALLLIMDESNVDKDLPFYQEGMAEAETGNGGGNY
jgi:heme/copper-type cytochrome/quinol oxidase subunit 4